MSTPVVITTPTIAGQVGSLLTYFDRVLCLLEAVHFDGAVTYTDRSAEARSEGGTAFLVLGTTSDVFYLGYDAPFSGLRIDVATAGAGLTLVVEYWNGTAWTAVMGLIDGTTALSVDGAVTWTLPLDWVKNSVNVGPTCHHVRLRTTTLTTAPIANYLVVNWTIYDGAAGTNAKVYKSIGETGTASMLLWVSDNGTEYTGPRNAAWRWYETWDASLHTGTAPTPTAAQVAAGLGLRKSATVDAVARTVYAAVSRDYVILSIFSGDLANQAHTFQAVKLMSYVVNDAWGLFIAGFSVDSSVAAGSWSWALHGGALFSTAVGMAGQYMQRAYSGTGASIQIMRWVPGIGTEGSGYLAYPNGPDGTLHLMPADVIEPTRQRRGRIPGHAYVMHDAAAAITNGDIVTDSVGQRWLLFAHRVDTGNTQQCTRWGALRAVATG